MIEVSLPGSKSVSSRALCLAAISPRATVLHNVLPCEDIDILRTALATLGVQFDSLEDGGIKVTPPRKLQGNNSQNFMGNAGAPTRFLLALSFCIEGAFFLDGVERLRQRPMQEFFEVLEKEDVHIAYKKQRGALPAMIESTRSPSGIIALSGKTSSQFLSGLLMVGTQLEEGIHITLDQTPVSEPYVKMTVDMLRLWGADVEESDDYTSFQVKQGIATPESFTIPPDGTSMTYPIVYSLLSKQSLRILDFPEEIYQGDVQFLDIAVQFGARVSRSQNSVEIHPPEKLTAIGTMDFSHIPDTVPSAAVLAMFTDGETKFTNVEHLRHKESDRITNLREALEKLNVNVKEGKDWMSVQGRDVACNVSTTIDPHEDHRVAMAFGTLAKALSLNIEIEKPECVNKSWPEFWTELASWAGELRRVSAIIVQDKEKYLIVKKPRKDHAWQFPQGGVEEGETLLEGAERELKEECGEDLCAAFFQEPVGEYAYFFPADFVRHCDGKKPKHRGARVTFFRAEFIEGDIELEPAELEDYKWVTREELGDWFEGEYLEEVERFL